MIRFFFAAYVLALCIAIESCAPIESPHILPQPSTFTVLKSGNAIGISAPDGSADPGTTVNITTGGSGSGTAGPDGSVAFNGTVSDGPLTLSYRKATETLVTEVTVAPLDSLVSKPRFSTGSAPNDMELADGSLFIANSLDNTVVRYGIDGNVQDTAHFAEFAGPAYLQFAKQQLYVTTNGSNELDIFDLTDLSLTPEVVALDGPSLHPEVSYAFYGPGKPAINPSHVIVPLAAILDFGLTTSYGNRVTVGHALVDSELDLEFEDGQARNGTYAIYNPARNETYVIYSGELQFDEQFHPYLASHSFLRILDDENLPVWLSDFGTTGISSMAISPDGQVAYFGNLLTGDVFKFNLETRALEDTIELTDEFTYVADVEFTPDGKYLLASSFNTDEVYVIDTATDTVNPAPYPGPFDMSLDPQLLAGTSSIEVDNAGHAYVLYSVANAVAQIDLLP